MSNGLSELYVVKDYERRVFGDRWCGPTRYKRGEEHLVARYPAIGGGDGQPVEIYVAAFPARALTIKALEGVNSIGQVVPAFTLQTGSGDEMHHLAVKIAVAVSEGMLGIAEGGRA
jgi:hypothetical protein